MKTFNLSLTMFSAIICSIESRENSVSIGMLCQIHAILFVSLYRLMSPIQMNINVETTSNCFTSD